MTVPGITLGAFSAPGIAIVDAHGALHVPDLDLVVDWFVQSGQWRAAADDPSLRVQAAPGAPVAIARLAAGGGDVVVQAYGVAAPVPHVLVEFENATPDAVAVALRLRSASTGAPITGLDVDGTIVADAARDLACVARPPSAWAGATDIPELGPGSLVWPVAHRTRLRIAVPLVAMRSGELARVQPDRSPSADDVALGWDRMLDRSMWVECDDVAFAHGVQGARAALLLRAGADRPRPDATTVQALEDWGFDTEATEAWQRTPWRARRAARRRVRVDDAWLRVRHGLDESVGGVPNDAAGFLVAARASLLVVDADGTVDLLPAFPAEWLGLGVAVHDAPTRAGLVSFALRWHGGRPALLWDVPAGVPVRSSRLDPEFRGAPGAGEQLLGEPPAGLLDLHKIERVGDPVADPGSFD